MIFDVANGEVVVGHKTVRGGMSQRDIERIGFVWDREIDMKTGWVFRVGKPDSLGMHRIVPAMGFLEDRLKQMNVSFIDDDADSKLSKDERHRHFLRQQLGVPTKENSIEMSYDLSWGAIASEVDPRTNSAFMIIIWN